MQALERLHAAWQAETHIGRKACLQAQKASWQIRWGDEEAARSASSELRRAFAGQEFPRLSATLCLVDGLLLDRQGLRLQANDRFLRAKQMAQVCAVAEVQAWSGAWLAHQYGQLEQWALCAPTLCEVLSTVQRGHSEALWRVALTAANVFMRAGWPALAQTWYARAREQASRAGDGLAMGQVLHDVAVAQVERFRRLAPLGALSSGPPLPQGDLAAAESLVAAASNYVSISKSPALRALRPRLQWAQASLSMWRGASDLALQTLARLTAPGRAQGEALSADLLLQCQVDQGWCLKDMSTLTALTGFMGSEESWDGPSGVLTSLPTHLRWVTLQTACDVASRHGHSGYDSRGVNPGLSLLHQARDQALADWRLSHQRLRAVLNANRLEPERWGMLYEP